MRLARLDIKDLTKSLGTPPKKVLDGVSMTLWPGMNCLMGPSGAGKTTLANILAGLMRPDGGSVGAERDGGPVSLCDVRVSCVFQEDRLFGYMSALSNVLYAARAEKKSLAANLLKEAGLADSAHKKARELSGGMKRRVAICRALVAECELLILDEPFKGLDDELKKNIMLMVADAAREKLALCITHDRDEAAFLGGHLLDIRG